MVKVELVNGEWKELPKGDRKKGSLYLDGILKKNLDNAKKIIKRDWDFLWVADGMEGAGKSVFMIQVAYYLTNGKFNLEQITYSPKEFKDQILKCPKHGCVIFDEAFRGMSARAAMTQTNRMLMGMLQEIRQKNLFVIIILPSIWDLDKYVAIHRTAGLFHIEVGKDRERGFFKYYNKDQLTNLLRDYKLKYKYPFSPKFKGRFTNFNPFDEEYRKKKANSLGNYGYEEEIKSHKDKHNESVMKAALNLQKKGYTYREMAEIFDKSDRWVAKTLEKGRLKYETPPQEGTNFKMMGEFNNTN